MASNPDDLTSLAAAAGGGGGFVGLIMGLFGWSARRNIAQIDDKLEGLDRKFEAMLSELRRYDVALIGLNKDVGYLSAEKDKLEGRVSGLQNFWKEEFATLKKEIHDALESQRHANHDFKNEIIRSVLEIRERVEK